MSRAGSEIDCGGEDWTMNEKKPLVRQLAANRRARRDYELLEKLEAGVALTGTEVKSARAGRIQLKDSYVEIRDGEAWWLGAHISPYTHGNRENHDPERPRKLLLHRREIDRLMGATVRRGLTVIPLAVYLKGNNIKLEIALAQGRKLYDKREAKRRQEQEREAAAAIKEQRY